MRGRRGRSGSSTPSRTARASSARRTTSYTRAPIGGGPVITPHELDALFEGRAFSVFNEDVMALTPELDWGVGLRLSNTN